MLALNNTLDQMDLYNTYIQHILSKRSRKPILKGTQIILQDSLQVKLKNILINSKKQVISSISSNHNGLKLEVSYKKSGRQNSRLVPPLKLSTNELFGILYYIGIQLPCCLKVSNALLPNHAMLKSPIHFIFPGKLGLCLGTSCSCSLQLSAFLQPLLLCIISASTGNAHAGLQRYALSGICIIPVVPPEPMLPLQKLLLA